MADEKILKDEILKDDQLDEVAGGSYAESYDQIVQLSNIGIGFYYDRDASVNKLGGLYAHAGIKLVAHNGENHPNEYINMATGQTLESGVAFAHLVNTINAYRARGVIVN